VRVVKSKIVGSIVGLALLGGAPQASATTLLDTIQGAAFNPGGSGWEVYNNGASPPGGQSVGIEFTLASSATIGSVEAYIFPVNGLGVDVDLGIMANSSSLPSGTFISGDYSVVSTSTTVPVNLSSLSWSLAAGSYWLVAIATSGSDASWQAGSTGLFASDGATGGGTWTGQDLPIPMALISTATVSATPLPAALPLFATGLGAMGLLGWRRKRKNAAAIAA
jgi:hypothetical protein